MDFWGKGFQKLFDCLLCPRGPQDFSSSGKRGARAELLAARFLKTQGARILARNVRYPEGEIDLIALQGGQVLFVEVRFRTHAEFGGAAASISGAKQRRLVLAARHWLNGPGSRFRRYPERFDAILLERLDIRGIHWVQNAFEDFPD